jgi:hypothetical protein
VWSVRQCLASPGRAKDSRHSIQELIHNKRSFYLPPQVLQAALRNQARIWFDKNNGDLDENESGFCGPVDAAYGRPACAKQCDDTRFDRCGRVIFSNETGSENTKFDDGIGVPNLLTARCRQTLDNESDERSACILSVNLTNIVFHREI